MSFLMTPFFRLQRFLLERATVRDLQKLDDRILADLGIERGMIGDQVRRF